MDAFWLFVVVEVLALEMITVDPCGIILPTPVRGVSIEYDDSFDTQAQLGDFKDVGNCEEVLVIGTVSQQTIYRKPCGSGISFEKSQNLLNESEIFSTSLE
jgi:hypothetical protein